MCGWRRRRAGTRRFLVAKPVSPPAANEARSFRLAILLAVVLVLNGFDLAFTQAQIVRGNFAEANILAAAAVDHGATGAAAYKAGLLAVGIFILYRFRRHRAAETGAWVLAVSHVALMIWWVAYLQAIEICIRDPFTELTPVPF